MLYHGQILTITLCSAVGFILIAIRAGVMWMTRGATSQIPINIQKNVRNGN